MYFKQISIGGYDHNFSYLIGDANTKEVAVVDPDNLPMIEKIVQDENLKITAIFITHEHFDHISGIPEALKRWSVPIYAHELAIEKIGEIDGEVRGLIDREEIEIGSSDSITLKVIHTPGHSPGSVCYLVENKLIVGDILFVGGCGRCDLPGGDLRAMWKSFNKLKELPNDIEIYPGHDYGKTPYSTLGNEKNINQFFSCERFSEFLKKR